MIVLKIKFMSNIKMKNKFNIPHHKGITILRHPDIIEEYNTLFYYVHRRIKNYNVRYTASVF